MDGLLERKDCVRLPSHDTLQQLASRFGTFFSAKIDTNRASFPADADVRDEESASDIILMESFEPATEEEIRKLILRSPAKSCSLGPLPTSMLKDNVDLLAPFLTRVVDASLVSGVVPDSMKHAQVTPLLKKQDLDPECLKNYRPVSNLSFASKLLERVVAHRLLSHV